MTPVPVGYGTTSRCLAVAEECRRRGQDVLFACAEKLRDRIEERGFTIHPIEDSEPTSGGSRPPAQCYLNRHTPALLERQLGDLARAIDVFGADVVVSSHNMVALLAAGVADIPSVSLFHPGIIALSSPGITLALFAERLRMMALERRARPVRRVEPPPFGDLSCIPSIPELIEWPWFQLPSTMRRKESAVPVGALLNQPPQGLPPREELRRELGMSLAEPMVYATVGGAIGEERYARLLVEGVRKAGVQALMAVGRGVSADVVQRLGDERVRVTQYVAGDDLAAMAAADVILWHGGHETMLKAAACGVPAVGVPFEYDQHANVQALARTGAALRVDRRGLSAERVARGVQRVISDANYSGAAGRLAGSNRLAGGAPRVMDLVEERLWRRAAQSDTRTRAA